MENDLKLHMLDCASAFCVATKLADSTLGRMATADGRFFERLRDGKTFTLRKYDEVMLWFSNSWPDTAVWPDNVPRPRSIASSSHDDAVIATDKPEPNVGQPAGELIGGAE